MSNSQNWSLRNEILKLSGCKSLKDSFEKFGMLKGKNIGFKTIENKEGWIRGGAETYIFKFSILQDDGHQVNFIIKACVAFSPGSNPEDILDSWVKRRNLLHQEGIKVPYLYAHGFGILIEEYIPFSLKDIIIRSNREKFFNYLVSLAAGLGRLGFTPISPFSDLRSRGDDLVMIDFGQDLGTPNLKKAPNESVFKQLLNQIETWDLKMSDEIKDKMFSQFQERVHIKLQ